MPVFFAHLAAAFSPGPAVLMTVRIAASRGIGPAGNFALGLSVGAVIWALAALLGMALLFQIVPSLFWGLKVFGAAFLVYLGIKTWRSATEPLDITPATPRCLRQTSNFRLGLVLQLTNPKPAVFFGAVFVTLVPPAAPWPWLAVILVLVFANEFTANLLIARIFSLPRARAVYSQSKRWIERVFGMALTGFGLSLALD